LKNSAKKHAGQAEWTMVLVPGDRIRYTETPVSLARIAAHFFSEVAMPLPFSAELRRSELDRKLRLLEITPERIFYDGKALACADIVLVRGGTLQLKAGLGSLGTAEIHEYCFRDTGGHALRLTFSAAYSKKRRESAAALFAEVGAALAEAVLDRLAAELAARIAGGGNATVGRLVFSGGQLSERRGLLFRKSLQLPLTALVWKVENGLLLLKRAAGGVVVRMQLLRVWNALVLAMALDRLGIGRY
jgi:hypothetical protein